MSQATTITPVTGAPDAPLRAGGRTVLVLAAVCGLCVSNLYYILPLLPVMASSLHESEATLARLASVTQVGYAVGLILLVPLADAVDRRRLVSVLIALSGVMVLVIPFTSGWVAMLAFLGNGVVTVSAMIIVPWVADHSPDAERGRVVGTVMTGLVIGALLCRTFAGLVAGAASWRVVYWVAAGFMTLSLVAVRRVMPATPRRPGARLTPGGYRRLVTSVVTIAVGRPRVLERCALGALGFGAFSVFWTILPLHLSGPGFRYGSVGIGLFGLLGVAGAVGAALAGRLADRQLQRVTTIGAFVLASALFVLLGATPGVLAVIVLGTLLLDLAVQAAHITNQSIVYAGTAEARGRVTTAYMTSYFAGGAAGSWSATIAWEHGGWSAACWVGVGFTGAALLLAAFGRRRA